MKAAWVTVVLVVAVATAVGAQGPWFVEGPKLPFTHQNGAAGRLSLPEIMGGGVGLVDLDGDGRLDLLLIDSGGLTPPGKGRKDLLLRNVGLDERGVLRFEPFPPLPPGGGYGMGVSAGDIDGDGHIDLVLTAMHGDRVLRNLGGGRFEDVTAQVGLDRSRWSTAAVLADLDGDGDLDLWVGAYVAWDSAREPECFAPSTRRDYCGPSAFTPSPDRILLNRGDGTFGDATVAWGLDRRAYPALGGTAFDANGDGRLELYIANDGTSNNLWSGHGQGDGALLAGLAVNAAGRPEAGMGVVAADLNGDGDEDLLLTHLAAETNTLYDQQGDGFFLDTTARSGLGPPSLAHTGFGVCALDANLDGVLDLVVVNGAVRLVESRLAAGLDPLAEKPQLFLGLDGSRFREATVAESGPLFGEELVGRGLACGDVDGDGDTDLLVGVNGGRPRLLLGQAIEGGARSVSVRVKRASGLGDELGTEVRLSTSSGVRTGRIRTDGGYLAAHEPKVIFAVRPGEQLRTLELVYPDGRRELFEVAAGATAVVLTRGSGRVVPGEAGTASQEGR